MRVRVRVQKMSDRTGSVRQSLEHIMVIEIQSFSEVAVIAVHTDTQEYLGKILFASF
jgi:hypothetical protein